MKRMMSDYEEVLSDSTLRFTARRLVLKCGVRANHKGCERLIDAVILYGTGLCPSFCEVYRMIGELHGLKPKSVMRDISYAISQAFEISARLSSLVGVDIRPADVHSGLVIAYLGALFANPSETIFNG